MKGIDLTFQQYYRPLCLYALHYLHDVDEAEDIVQDCFVRMLETERRDAASSAPKLSLSNPQNQKSFLYTSVRNACVDQLRRKILSCKMFLLLICKVSSLMSRRWIVPLVRRNCGRR